MREFGEFLTLLVGTWHLERIITISLCFRGKKRIFAPPKGAYIIYKVYLYVRDSRLEGDGRVPEETILTKNNNIIMENLSIGLQLLVVGMLTVFAILLIVIYGGKLLIKVVNAIAPEEVAQAKKTVAQAAPGAVDAPTMAVLQEVVKQLTGGKGRVESAKRV